MSDRPLPQQIASSVRWTFWLSIAALPFSYATNVLLARIGPEALGSYGVLTVYIGVVFVLFFLGGCAVPMRFLPGTEVRDRSSFLVTYAIVLISAFLPWLAIAMWRPQLLHFVFGSAGTSELHLRMIWLSPLCLGYLLMITSLKGLLEMKWAQLLERGITVGQTSILLSVFLLNASWLRQHVPAVLWLSYIALTCTAGTIALVRLRAVGAVSGRPRLWLPSRFWRYTLLLHANGILSAIGTRLDYVIILNAAGLPGLGQYVAITSVASLVPRISGFVIDSLLPALTNSLARGDADSTARVAETHLRFLFPTVLWLCLVMLALVRPILAMMGSQYQVLAGLSQLALVGAVAQSLNAYNSTILTATDRLHHNTIATFARSLTFIAVFWLTWAPLQLAGAIVSWSAGELAYHAATAYLLRSSSRLRIRVARSYAGLLSALPAMVALGRSGVAGDYAMAPLWAATALVAFGVCGCYTRRELIGMARLMISVRFSRQYV